MKNFVLVTNFFSSAHFYHQPLWSNERNDLEFGKCHTPHGHGHNYRLEIEFEAPEGWTSLPDLEAHLQKMEISQAIEEEVDRLDHRHLNHDISEFKDLVPTTENIAKALLQRLIQRQLHSRISCVRLFEMDDLWVEIRPQAPGAAK